MPDFDFIEKDLRSDTQKRSLEAVAQIYARYSVRLYRYGLKFTHNHTLIEDSIQDVFTSLVRNRKSLHKIENMNGYLMTSLRRDLIRKINRERLNDYEMADSEIPFDVVWSAEHETILQEMENDKALLLQAALNDLTNRQKEAIYLRFSAGHDYSSIADIMHISIAACRNLISQSVKSLKNQLVKK